MAPMVCLLCCKLQPCSYSDDVRAEFCSDVNSVCCRTKLSKLLSDDWSKNDDEEWGESDLHDCKSVVYKVILMGGEITLYLPSSGQEWYKVHPPQER